MTDSSTAAQAPANSRLVWIGTLLAILLAGGALVFMFLNRGNAAPTDSNTGAAVIDSAQEFDGVTRVEPPRVLQDFTLTNQDNQPTSLRSLRGQYTLLLFGYTHCPDVCPLTLLKYKRVKEGLGDLGGQVNFVFISVDGERDTPERLKPYLRNFDEAFIGLTGDEATLRRLGPDYNLFFEMRPGTTPENYLVDHTASTFLIDPDGNLVAIYPYDVEATGVDTVVADLRARMDGQERDKR
jgi:protein SCO1/2